MREKHGTNRCGGPQKNSGVAATETAASQACLAYLDEWRSGRNPLALRSRMIEPPPLSIVAEVRRRSRFSSSSAAKATAANRMPSDRRDSDAVVLPPSKFLNDLSPRRPFWWREEPHRSAFAGDSPLAEVAETYNVGESYVRALRLRLRREGKIGAGTWGEIKPEAETEPAPRGDEFVNLPDEGCGLATPMTAFKVGGESSLWPAEPNDVSQVFES